MGLCMPHFSLRDDTDTVSLAHIESNQQNDTEDSQHEGGFRLHRKKDCPYPLPSDPTGMDKLNLQHDGIQHATRKRYFAPLDGPRHAIDIGTGSGRWILEMAEEFPECHFLGIDITPLPSTITLPSNYHIKLLNVLDGIPKPKSHQCHAFIGADILQILFMRACNLSRSFSCDLHVPAFLAWPRDFR
jgi:hypothetical protein